VNRVVSIVVLGCSAGAAWAVDADPQSNPCQQALAALEARESELTRAARADAPARIPTDARWQALRREAARACLGREGAASAPLPHSAQPPIAVPPVAVPPAPQPSPPAEAAQRRASPPLPGYKPPVSVMSCDPLGCWTSDGARLPHTGRNPLDARVRCSVQGQIVFCL
jgi:hypothetical protein